MKNIIYLFVHHTAAEHPLAGADIVHGISYSDSITLPKNITVRFKNLGEKFSDIHHFFLEYLRGFSVPTAHISQKTSQKIAYEPFTPFRFSIKVSNVTDKKTAKLFGKKELEPISLPLFTYFLSGIEEKQISESHILSFGLAAGEELKLMNRIASKANVLLKSFFERRILALAEIHLFFGRIEEKNGGESKRLVLAGDFSPAHLKIYSPSEKKPLNTPFISHSTQTLKLYTEFISKAIDGSAKTADGSC